MSAHIESPAHFYAIAAFAIMRPGGSRMLSEYRLLQILKDTGYPETRLPPSVKLSHAMTDRDLATVVCHILHAENVASIRYRYPDLDDEQLPGPLPHPTRIRPVKVMDLTRRTEKPIDILVALDGLEYQSSEHPEWNTSAARKIIDVLRSAAVKQLDGYGDSNCWSIEE